MGSRHQIARGVHSVLVTPFAEDESLDEQSLANEVDYYAKAQVSGVVVLGVLGEADRLSDAERERIIQIALEQAKGRVQVTVGITHQSTLIAIERAKAAEQAGASAVMVAPPKGSFAGIALLQHFSSIAENIAIPLVVQDYPASSGVRMPVDFLAQLANNLPIDPLVKLEDPPTGAKIARLRNLVPDLFIMGGLSGMFLLQELQAGADGSMTGFAAPEFLVQIITAYQSGNIDHAHHLFGQVLPFLIFEAQPVVGLGIRKEFLCRRGVITNAIVRSPAMALDQETLTAFDHLFEAFTQPL